MPLHEFTLSVALPQGFTPEEHANLPERFAAAGGTDVTLGLGQPGRLGLMVAREAPSMAQARASVIDQVLAVIPGARPLDDLS